jgi:hypothetical protein
LPDTQQIDEMSGHMTYMGEMRNVYKILAGIPERKRPIHRSRLEWRIILKSILNRCGVDSTGFR